MVSYDAMLYIAYFFLPPIAWCHQMRVRIVMDELKNAATSPTCNFVFFF